jgi:uncharacterized protein YkwD
MRLLPLLVILVAFAIPAVYGDDSKSEKPFKLTEDEQTIFDLTNKAREKEKLPPLKLNPLLCKVARAHSANMAKQERMAHELDGKNPSQRMKEAGYQASWGGENVAMADGETTENIFKMWMDSPPHRANILKDKFKEIGVGVAKNAKGEVYYTQVFGTPRKK